MVSNYDIEVDEFLNHRDRRVYFQKCLSEKFKKTIICLRVNYPGNMKNNYYSRKINEIFVEKLEKEFENKILFKTTYISLEGPITILVINTNSNEVKKECINIEEAHFLGRLVDIDVYDKNYRSLSRVNFHKNPRQCFICEDIAFNCSRSKRHSLNEIELYIKNKVIKYLNLS